MRKTITDRILVSVAVMTAGIVMLVVAQLCIGMGTSRFASCLIWEFSTPIDRMDLTDRHDLMLAVVCPIGKIDDSTASVLQALRDLSLNYIGHDGRHFRITIACDPCEMDSVTFDSLSDLCSNGAGEIEYLLSSGLRRSGMLESDLRRALTAFNSHGWAVTSDSVASFAAFGTVTPNDSITVLSGEQLCSLESLGCYADLSSPTVAGRTRPRRCNSIYSVSSRSTGRYSNVNSATLKVGAISRGEILVIDAPMLIDWTDWRHMTAPYVEDGCLHTGDLPDGGRAKSWIRANVHVVGQPDWVFVKLIFDIQSDTTVTLRQFYALRQALEHLESLCSDQFRLHYVTAREMCNISRAAEARKSGNAGQYRDYLVKPYVALRRSITITAGSEQVEARHASTGKNVVN